MRVDSGAESGSVMASWYLQSLNAHNTHRGHLRRGRVLAACGVEFSPVRDMAEGWLGFVWRAEPPSASLSRVLQRHACPMNCCLFSGFLGEQAKRRD